MDTVLENDISPTAKRFYCSDECHIRELAEGLQPIMRSFANVLFSKESISLVAFPPKWHLMNSHICSEITSFGPPKSAL